MKSRNLFASACLVALATSVVAEQPERGEDRTAISQRTQALVKAIGGADATEVAACWTPEGEYVGNDGQSVRGRENLEKAYKSLLSKKSKLSIEVESAAVRFLGKDTAVEEGTFQVNRDRPNERSSNRFSILYVRDDGHWRIGQLREWSEGPSLHELDWLIGSWRSKSDKLELHTTYEWGVGKAFLLSRFTLKSDDRTIVGMQILGRDPATGAIRGWTFGSEGGIDESTWVRQEKRWVIQMKGTSPDGETLAATTYLTPTDAKEFSLQSVERTVEGEKVSDVGPIKLVRENGEK